VNIRFPLLNKEQDVRLRGYTKTIFNTLLMTWILVLIVFFAGGITALLQIIKINRIVLKSGVKILDGTGGMPSGERKAIVKAFFIAIAVLIGALLIIGLIFYLQNPGNFKIYY
jgi:acid phosphatase family membrane protein YuiD